MNYIELFANQNTQYGDVEDGWGDATLLMFLI